MQQIPYKEVLGSLLYAAVCTRPDLAGPVAMAGRVSHNPSMQHWQWLKHILRYVKGTLDLGIRYSAGGNNVVSIYSDSDYAGDRAGRKSTSGMVAFLNGGPISWSSQKQQTVSLSTCEAEYIAMTGAAAEVQWLRQLLEELTFKQKGPTEMMCDNTAAQSLAKNDVLSSKTKHIEIRHHFIRQQIRRKHVKLVHCSTKEQIADLFTKAHVGKEQFVHLRDKLMWRVGVPA
jgi:hypothetical protein